MQTIKRNSFSFGHPLETDAPTFVLRGAELNDVNQLLDSNGAVLLLGPRRIGKTTFLHTIAEHPPKEYLPVLVDLQAILSTSVEQLFAQLAQAVVVSLNLTIKTDIRNSRDFVLQIKEATKILSRKGDKLLLLLDEFDGVPQEQLAVLSQTLRALLSIEGQELRIVICCGWSVLVADHSLGSPLTNLLSPYFLDYLTKEETEEILDTLREDLPKDQELESYQDFKDRVFYWTSGHPFLIQVSGFLSLKKIRESEAQLTASLADKMINEVVRLSSAFFGSSIRKIKENREALNTLKLILSGKSIVFSLLSEEVSALYFAGLIRNQSGLCILSSPTHEKVLSDSLTPTISHDPAFTSSGIESTTEKTLTRAEIERAIEQIVERI